MTKLGFNSNILKIIAAICMVIDHVGLLIFPQARWMRIVGRIAFPIFSFMIAEGAKYTRNKFKYFVLIFSVGIGCQLVYFFAMSSLDMCILITFSCSLLMIYALQYMKRILFSNNALWLKIASVFIFAVTVLCVYFFTEFFSVDYGFAGAMIPVFASFFDFSKTDAPESVRILDKLPIRVIFMGIGLIPLSMQFPLQEWSFLSIPLLLLYNGQRGRLKMKYFFYLFYPIHLGIIYAIFYVIKVLIR